MHAIVEKVLSTIKDGKDGRDGIDFDSFDFSLSEDCRTLTFKLSRDDTVVEKSVHFPVPLHRGIWSEKTEYTRGDFVTRDGSIWQCLSDSVGDKPGFSKAWRLVVKRGKR